MPKPAAVTDRARSWHSDAMYLRPQSDAVSICDRAKRRPSVDLCTGYDFSLDEDALERPERDRHPAYQIRPQCVKGNVSRNLNEEYRSTPASDCVCSVTCFRLCRCCYLLMRRRTNRERRPRLRHRLYRHQLRSRRRYIFPRANEAQVPIPIRSPARVHFAGRQTS